MQPPIPPTDETARLDALRRYGVLDTLPEQSLDDLTTLAAHICDAPISLISLVDEGRQWFKSKVGLDVAETARDISFCGHAILGTDLFVVPDASASETFVDNPLVTGDPHIRFYAGAPLTTPEGHNVGSLCVIDHVPRTLSQSQLDALRVLGRQVVAQLELRRHAHDLRESEHGLRRVFSSCPVAVSIHRTKGRAFVDINSEFTELLGWTREEVEGRTNDAIGMVDEATADAMRAAWLEHRGLRNHEFPLRTRAGEIRHLLLSTEFVELQREPHILTTYVDVTQQREADLAVRRLAAIVESSDDAIIGKDLKGVVTSWNRGAASLFGYTSDEMVGTPILQIIPDDRQSEEHYILDRISNGHSVEHFETLRQTKTGQLIDVSITASPIRDATGTVVGVSKIARSIAARKRSEATLRERDEQLRLYADHSPAAVAMFDRDMRYLVASRRWLEDYQLQGKPVIGRSHYDVFPDLPARWKDVHQRCLAGASERSTDDPFQRADGQMGWIRWEVRPWYRADRTIGGIMIFSEDITERRLALAALQSAEERMRFALQSADVGIWDTDYTTGTVRWSEITEAQYGLKPGTFPGTFDAFIERIHPDDRPHIVAQLDSAMRSGKDFSFQHRAVRPDGSIRWLNGAGRIYLDEHGQPLRGTGVSLDVTERHSLEAQYQQAQKMEAVGRLAGGIAHDFNNLLTSILGYCELLLPDLKPLDPMRRDIEGIHKAGVSAAQLTRQLLTFSRKQIIEPKLIDLNVIVAEMQGMIGRLIGEDITIVLALGSRPAVVLADRGQIEQVLMNLAVNARDAMLGGGTLTIETTEMELDANYASSHFNVEPGPYIALIVTDTGAGMTPEVQAHLFEPFFTTKPPGKGTGLGLATVHGIVTRSGGNVGVYSELGRGSSFKVYFPRTPGDVGADPSGEPVVNQAIAARTVLVVEDEDELRELTCRLLAKLGYAVLSAGNAEDAIQMVAHHPSIDVVLTDVVMPKTSGPALMRLLENQQPGLKSVYMSGYTEETIIHHGVINPGIAFLHKPFTLEALGRKIREALDAPRGDK